VKKPLLKKIIIFYAVFLFSNSVYAITLEECKISALRNSKLLEAYENLIKSSIYSNRKDTSTLFPQISGFYQPDHVQYGPNVDFARHGYRNKLGVNVAVDIPKILANYPQLSNLEVEKSKLIRKISENEILKNLTQDYYKLYVFLQKKKYYMDAQSYISAHIKDIDDLQSKGVDVKLDSIRAQVQLTSLYISVSNVNQEMTNALTSLNLLMNTEYKESDFSNMDAPDMATIETDQTVFDKNVPEANTKGSYIEDVKKNIPQKIAALGQSKLDELDVKLAKEKYRQNKFYYLPTLQGGYEHNAHTIDPSIETDRTFLALNLDIFDFGQKAYEGQQLKYSYESQKKLFDESQRKLKVRIDQLITEIEKIQTTYKNATDNMKNAEKALDTAKDYYQQGKIKETDMLSIFSEYMNAKDQSYEILYSFFAEKAELDSLIRGMDN
jgi:outer membrane protein TolC